MNEVADKLREAKALIERGWCQENYAVGKSGKVVDHFGRSAVCFCVRGAIERVAPHQRQSVEQTLAEVLPEPKIKWRNKIVDFNDTEGRTQAEVLAAFDKAIELAEQSA